MKRYLFIALLVSGASLVAVDDAAAQWGGWSGGWGGASSGSSVGTKTQTDCVPKAGYGCITAVELREDGVQWYEWEGAELAFLDLKAAKTDGFVATCRATIAVVADLKDPGKGTLNRYYFTTSDLICHELLQVKAQKKLLDLGTDVEVSELFYQDGKKIGYKIKKMRR